METLKRVSYIFICVFAIFLMSHNTFALDISSNVEFVQSWQNTSMSCRVRYGSWVDVSGNTCVFGTNTGLGGLQGSGLAAIKTGGVELVAGDYYQVFLDVSVSSGANKYFPVMWNLNTTSNYTIVDFQQVSLNTNMGTESTDEAYVTSYKIILRANYTSSGFPIELGYTDGSKNMLYLAGDGTPISVDVRITAINEFRAKTNDNSSVVDAINNQTQEEADSTQDAADASQSAGSSSAASAESATSSLISVIGGFVSVITSAQPTNCIINANMNHINMGNMDLCANPVPSYVQIIGSIILICAAIPLAIVLFNRFIGLFRSFQN